ncbi:MAG: helix-turn-helix domain-containing protein, partial [Gemmatimonadota bacterium]
NWSKRFDMVEAFLPRRLADAAHPDPGVAWAWRRLESIDGAIRIGDLARELGRSRRRLIDRLHSDVGLRPKVVARLLRFQGLRRLLRRRPKAGWAHLAALAGCHDQPHLSREVRQCTSLTPEALRRLLGPEAETVTLQDAAGKFVQVSDGGDP